MPNASTKQKPVQVFLSTVTSEFGELRREITKDLDDVPDVHVQVQERLGRGGRTLLETLDDHVANRADALIHLVGKEPGEMIRPAERDWLLKTYRDFLIRLPFLTEDLQADPPTVSYTQMEAWLGIYHGKDVHEFRPVELENSPSSAHISQQKHWRCLVEAAEHRAHFENNESLRRDVLKIIVSLRGSATTLADTMSPPLFMPVPQGGSSRQRDEIEISDLRYNKQLLSYEARPQAERQLRAFIASPLAFTWWGIVGEGGVGKTRLAYELALRIQCEDGWEVGFLDSGDQSTNWLMRCSRFWTPRKPTLIVVDYAAQRARCLFDGLFNLSKNLGATEEGHSKVPVRLLMLDRPGRVYPVSIELSGSGPHHGEKRDITRKTLFRSEETEVTDVIASKHVDSLGFDHQRSLRLEGLIEANKELSQPLIREHEMLTLAGVEEQHWPRLLKTLIAEVGGDPDSIPSTDNDDWWSQIARLTDEGRLLPLQILALCLVRRDGSTLGFGKLDGLHEVLDEMLAHERARRWPDLFPSRDEGREWWLKNEAFRRVELAVGFVTLCRGIDIPADTHALIKVTGIDPELLRTVLLRILRSDIANEDENTIRLPPLEPDLLGERLLLNITSQRSDPFGLDSGAAPDFSNWASMAFDINPAGFIESVVLLAHDFPHNQSTMFWLCELVNAAAERSERETLEQRNAIGFGLPRVFGLMCLADAEIPTALMNSIQDALQRSPHQWMCAFSVLVPATSLMEGKTGQGAIRFHSVIAALRDTHFEESLVTVDEWRDILATRALGMADAICQYSRLEMFEHLASWAEPFSVAFERLPEDERVQTEFCRGAFELVRFHATEVEPPNLAKAEIWGQRIRDVASQSESEAVWDVARRTAAGTIVVYCTAKEFPLADQWADYLEAAPDSDSVVVAVAKAAASIVAEYPAEAEYSERIEKNWQRLTQLSEIETEENDEDVSVWIVAAAGQRWHKLLDEGTATEVKLWGDRFWTNAARHSDHLQTQFHAALHIANGMYRQGRADNFKRLEEWGRRLLSIVDQHRASGLALSLVNASLAAIGTYASTSRVNDLRRWIGIYRKGVDRLLSAGFDFPQYRIFAEPLIQNCARANQLELVKEAIDHAVSVYRKMAGPTSQSLAALGQLCFTLLESKELDGRVQLLEPILKEIRRNAQGTQNGEANKWICLVAFRAAEGYGKLNESNPKKKTEKQYLRWQRLFTKSFPRAAVSDELFGNMFKSSMTIWSQHPHWGLEFMHLLAEVWPGYVPDFSHVEEFQGMQTPLAVMMNGPSIRSSEFPEDEKSDAELVIEWDECYSQFSESSECEIDRTSLIWLWEHRMYSSDRGDRLVPLLYSEDLTSAIEEALSDPWR